ncbi:class I SAM-dependent methyltransferase [Bordetella sp. LUAb4]|uniref:class I SAM-dependent methyltransferase n=1 Tax=Bordetella sp. LUAb4 TaxID=2843195 RepID=UPI001E2C57D3|nr:class I SAM-dependent methyltransferase [Bordetella sp. LUAb4]
MEKPEFDRFADEYYDMLGKNIQSSGESPEFFSEYKVQDVAALLRRTGLTKDIRILDFGAGIGNSVPYFRKHLPEADLTCVDVSARSLDVANKRFPGMAHYQEFDGKRLPLEDNTFDLVFTACVFHHIPESIHVPLFREISRVLKPGGKFVIFEHNPLNPLTVRAVNTCPFDENAVLIRAGNLKARIESAGFEHPTISYRIFFPHFLRRLRRFEPSLARLPLGAQYYVVATK